MKNYKGFTTFFALFILVIPGLSLADGTYRYGNTEIYEAAPVKTQGTITQSTPSTVYTVENPATIVSSWAPNLNIKSKAERDAERAAADAEMARKAEADRVAYNNNGSFAYGYTNGSGAQYTSTAKYVDARDVRNGNVAAAGTAFSRNFLPTTFWGWVLAILLIGILFAIVKAFADKNSRTASHAHAH